MHLAKGIVCCYSLSHNHQQMRLVRTRAKMIEIEDVNWHSTAGLIADGVPPLEYEPSIHQINEQLADRIDEEVKNNPSSPYAGKFVAIANGEVFAVCSSLEECYSAFGTMDPENNFTLLHEVGRQINVVMEVGGFH